LAISSCSFDKEFGTPRKRLTYITDAGMSDVQREKTAVDDQQIFFATGYLPNLSSVTIGGMYAS